MTPEEMSEIIRIARSRLWKCGVPMPSLSDLQAHVAMIMWRSAKLGRFAVSNRLVEMYKKDYAGTCARYSEKIEGSKKRKTVRLRAISWDDYLSAQDVQP